MLRDKSEMENPFPVSLGHQIFLMTIRLGHSALVAPPIVTEPLFITVYCNCMGLKLSIATTLRNFGGWGTWIANRSKHRLQRHFSIELPLVRSQAKIENSVRKMIEGSNRKQKIEQLRDGMMKRWQNFCLKTFCREFAFDSNIIMLSKLSI